MKRIVLFLTIAAIVFSGKLNAQRSCASFEHLQEQMKNDPAFAKKVKDNEQGFQNYLKNAPAARNTTVTIPVVVHVVYNKPEQNISDPQVQSQMDVLNEDFTATNNDYNNYDAGYGGVKGDMSIRFCVTQIRHVQTSRKSFGTNDGVKKTKQGGDDAIDPQHTLNIWVCNLGQNLLGYAQFPGGPANTFGIVILYSAFGRGSEFNLIDKYDLGRTATHEIGHCLGLRHIWGDATCGNDFVDDTPLHNAANFGCPGEGHRSTCTGTPLEMWMNYMDYTDDRCMYFFSDGQADRANFYLTTDPQLLTIVNSGACTTNGGKNNLITSNTPVRSAERSFENFSLYPTLTNGLVNIEYTSSANGIALINVYNQSGMLVDKQQMPVVEGVNSKQLNFGKLSNGFYLVQISQNNRQNIQKIVIQH
jgi:hypothetical protein